MSMRPLRPGRPSFGATVALLVLACAALLLPIGGSGSLDRAEVYFMDAARRMVETGDWLVPHYREQPFFDKPILTYWLIAVAFQVFGSTPEAARLIPAAAALATVLVTVWLGVLLHGRRAGLMGGCILATTLPFIIFGRMAMSDMPMTLLATLAVALAVEAYQSPRGRWLVPAVAAVLGLAFAAKGPIAVLLPALALAALAWAKGRKAVPLSPLPALVAVALFAILGFGWFLAVFWRLGPEPLRYFFLSENLARFSGSTYDSGRGPEYYVLTYLTQGAPWSILLGPAVVRVLRSRDRESGRDARWLALALLLMVVPLSLSQGKIDYYLLPLYPLAATLIGVFLAAPAGRGTLAWCRSIAVVAGVLALVGVALFRPKLPPAWLPSAPGRALTVAVGLAAVLSLAWVAWRPSRARLVAVLGAVIAAVFATFVYVWAPAFAKGQGNRRIVNDVLREHAFRRDARLVLCDDPSRVHRDLIFWSSIETHELCELWGAASSRDAYLLLLSEREWASLKRHPRLRLVEDYRYVPAEALGVKSVLRRERLKKLYLAANYPTIDPVAKKADRLRRREQRLREEKWRREREIRDAARRGAT
jgi:4-amino-4-deoxy-L-arabinose transferase-like glycosyltransferase